MENCLTINIPMEIVSKLLYLGIIAVGLLTLRAIFLLLDKNSKK